MSIQQIFIWLCMISCAFLCGCVMFSRILPKVLMKKDICALSPDGNPGAANVFTYCGIRMGLLCLFMDMAKGYLPVYIAYRVFGSGSLLFSLVITAPVLGHAIAPFDKIRGGKCISTAFGVLLAVLPVTRCVLILAGLYILFSTVIKINPNSKRRIVTFSLFGLISSVWLLSHGLTSIAAGCVLISAIAVYKHLTAEEKFPAVEIIRN